MAHGCSSSSPDRGDASISSSLQSDESRANAKRVGDYLWRESGKLAQKAAPEGFEGVKWWDL